MSNEIQTSKQLKISFDFHVLNHEKRILDIELKGYIVKIKWNEKYFDWFMEELIFFLDKNKYQKRWDYGKIIIHNLESLKLTKEQLKEFKSNFKDWERF